MKIKKINYYIVSVLILTSCNTYKDFQTVKSVPESLFGTSVACSDTTSLAMMNWKEFFNDKYLHALIDTALVRNTDYNIARLRIDQARASLGAANLAYFPSLGLSADGTVSDGMSSNVGLNASWEIDFFGRLAAAKKGATAAAVSAEEESHAVKTKLVATIANSYYSLLMLDRQIEIARATLDNWTETIRVMELLKTAGVVKETGILQTKASKVGLQADIVAMEKNVSEIENSLCSLLAQTPQRIERDKLEKTLFPCDLSVGLPIQILANRPDVRAAEMEFARTHYGVLEARASFYPSLTLGGTVGFTYNGGIVLNPGQWLLNAIGQLVQPIFNRGQLKANYKIAEADREIAKLRFNRVLLDAGKEVNNALAVIDAARKQLSFAKEQIELLDKSIKKTEMLMQHSSINYLEVLIAQQSFLNAQQMEVKCRYEEISGIISLYYSLGGGY